MMIIDLFYKLIGPERYIKLKLRSAKKKFNEMSFKYEIKPFNTHVIHVLPFHMYENDYEYMDFEHDMEKKFDSIFKYHEIMFVSEKSLTEVNNPIFTI